MSAHLLLDAGKAAHQQGRLAEAEALYRQALPLPEAMNALGIALQQQDRPDEAIDQFRSAIAAKPDYAAAHGNLGAALHRLKRWDEAIAVYRDTLARWPERAETYYNLASAYQELDRLDAAADAYAQALALRPDHAGAWNNLGITRRQQGRLDEALIAYRRSLALDPAPATVHYNHAQALLEAGDYAAGWAEHEYRFAAGISRPRSFACPRWDGGTPAGKTLLVWPEQGFGDTIQFLRLLPPLAARGAKVIFEAPKRLAPLCRGLSGVTIVTEGHPLPPCDSHVPLMSLPFHLGLTVDTIPAAVPYLHPTAASLSKWHRRLAPGDGLRRVALVWSGNPHHPDDRNRSAPATALAGLRAVTGVRFYSFQFGPAAAEFPHAGLPGAIDLSAEIGDFESTAAALMQMDLLLSIDSSALHLAGAIGVPAWGLLCLAPDWRWLQDREDTPWYPAIRLFRQSSAGDWEGVVQRVAVALR